MDTVVVLACEYSVLHHVGITNLNELTLLRFPSGRLWISEEERLLQ